MSTIGDVTLDAGTLLLLRMTATRTSTTSPPMMWVPGTTTGTVSVLINGADLGLSGSDFVSLMVVTDDLNLPGAVVPGRFDYYLGDRQQHPGGRKRAEKVSSDELFYLTVSSTTQVTGLPTPLRCCTMPAISA